MPIRKYVCVVLWLLALWPASASASGMPGLLTLIVLTLLVAPLILLHLVVMLVLAVKGIYRSQAAALWHAAIASVAPVLCLLVAMVELGSARHAQSLFIVSAIVLVALAVAWLPILIHHFQKPAGSGEQPG